MRKNLPPNLRKPFSRTPTKLGNILARISSVKNKPLRTVVISSKTL